MGNTIWFRVEGGGAGSDDDDHSIMAKLSDELDVLAIELGVETLSAFFDHSEVAADYAEFDADVEPEWFEAASGLATVDALAQHLAANPAVLAQSRSRAGWRSVLVEELAAAQRFLALAIERKLRFHFLVVP